jgi:hypothetical protein
MTDATRHLGRNDPCHCGSGRKYKQCCLAKDEADARAARAKALDEAPAPAAQTEGEAGTPAPEAPAPPSRQRSFQPWKKQSATNTHGFQRMSVPRKVGGG